MSRDAEAELEQAPNHTATAAGASKEMTRYSRLMGTPPFEKKTSTCPR